MFEDLYELAEECLAPMVRDPSNRGRSWDRCYSFFQQYRALNQEQQQANKELACLHLGFYLASWGMFRGSGYLIYKDYTIYERVIDRLIAQEYEGLWEPQFFEDLLTNENPILENNKQVGLIFKLSTQIQDYINEMTIIKNHRSPEENARATDTITTKILLGTLACTPAYDTYFPMGLATCDIRRCGSFTIHCFVNLLNVCRENELWARLEEQPIEYYGVLYPVMRVVDLYFWTKGFNANMNNH